MVKQVVVENLIKDFNGVRAVDGISFEVEDKEIFGLLGPNGAGKTTTIMILVTLLKPTSGKAFVAGYDVLKNPSAVRKNIGVVFQETTLDLELTARENLDFHARLYGLSRSEREKRINKVLELVDLQDKADEVVKNFSGGMKRRLEIARGFIHSPKVLFLDEPTLGLDAHTRRKIWKYIEELRERDVTIFLTTHYIEEAEKLCDRVAIMNRGKIIANDKPKNLIETNKNTVIITGYGFENALEDLRHFEYVVYENELRIFLERCEEVLPKILQILYKNNVEVKSISIKKPSLEDVFVELTKQ